MVDILFFISIASEDVLITSCNIVLLEKLIGSWFKYPTVTLRTLDILPESGDTFSSQWKINNSENVAAILNHSETELSYTPQQGYTDAGTYPITISAFV